MQKKGKNQNVMRRRRRIRAKIQGTAERPRVSVFRSNRSLFVQLIDDTVARTLASSGGRERGGASEKDKGKSQSRTAIAGLAGVALAEQAKTLGITRAVFDRGGYRYHGAVRAVAEALRAGGIQM